MPGLIARITDDGLVASGSRSGARSVTVGTGRTAATSWRARTAHGMTTIVILIKIGGRWTGWSPMWSVRLWRRLGGVRLPVLVLDGLERGLSELVISHGGLFLQLGHKAPAEVARVRQRVPLAHEAGVGFAQVGEGGLLVGDGYLFGVAGGGGFEGVANGDLVENDEIQEGFDAPDEGGAAGLHSSGDVVPPGCGEGGVFVGVHGFPGDVVGWGEGPTPVHPEGERVEGVRDGN